MLSQIQLIRHAGFFQLPAGEAAALQQGPGLIHPDADFLALLMRRGNHADRSTDTGSGQAASVAMGEDARLRFYQCRAVRRHRAAQIDIFLKDRHGFITDVFAMCTGSHFCLQSIEIVHQVHCRRSRGTQFCDQLRQLLAVCPLFCTMADPECCCNTDQGRTAYRQPLDKRDQVVDTFTYLPVFFCRQQALVKHIQLTVLVTQTGGEQVLHV